VIMAQPSALNPGSVPAPSVLDSELVTYLKRVPDYRSKQGRRYPLWLMLLMSLLGVMSGCQGYQALEEFGVRHYPVLCQELGLSLKRMPSDTTIRTMFRAIDFAQLQQQFNAWAKSQFACHAQEWLAVDGKSIRGTVQGGWESFQNFVGVVSVYSHQRRLVLAQQGYQNKGQSEIEVVRQLLGQLGMSGVVVTMDALHAQKNSPDAGGAEE
jgi:DDE_Tnp_1-associated